MQILSPLPYTLNIKGRLFSLDKPQVMGIVNVTPDSFYSGSRTQDDEAIAARCRTIRDEGATIIDIGAYSSRPGADDVPAAEEMARLGVECGVSGFIAPATRPDRIRAIREVVGDRKILSPGVGAQGGKASDAIAAGATYAIVGRAIYGSEDPRVSALSFAEDIRTVL